MHPSPNILLRGAALLAINLLFLTVWGFAGLGKILSGPPDWFPEKFGGTVLARFPGLTATFWILAIGELFGFLLAAAALLRGDFLVRRPPVMLGMTLVWSLFLFVQLGFGQWLTSEFAGAHQQFMYFCGSLVALGMVAPEVFTRAPLGRELSDPESDAGAASQR